MKRSVLLLGLAGCLGLAAACGDAMIPVEQKNPGTGKCDSSVYPCGPYGYVEGQVVEDVKLVGRKADPASGSPVDSPVQTLAMHDYYKNKSLKVLVVLVAAEWCSPCRQEQAGLIDLYNSYAADKKGVAFVEALIQDNGGKPADITVADRWAKTSWAGKKIPFDIAADPTVALGPYYDVAAFPMQMVIDLKDMTIDWRNNGLANSQLQQHIDRILKQ